MDNTRTKHKPKPPSMYRRLVSVAIAGAVVIAAGTIASDHLPARFKPQLRAATAPKSRAAGPAPQQHTVYDGNGTPLATFTHGARTVLMQGSSRTFTDPRRTQAKVSTVRRERLYTTPYTGTVEQNALMHEASLDGGPHATD